MPGGLWELHLWRHVTCYMLLFGVDQQQHCTQCMLSPAGDAAPESVAFLQYSRALLFHGSRSQCSCSRGFSMCAAPLSNTPCCICTSWAATITGCV